jgi:hypothetical protein
MPTEENKALIAGYSRSAGTMAIWPSSMSVSRLTSGPIARAGDEHPEPRLVQRWGGSVAESLP